MASASHRLRTRILADLQQAGFPPAESDAVQHTPPMWRQITRFYRNGGRVVAQPGSFAAANGAPQKITIYLPADPAQRTCSDYETLAHELGHALFYPAQWRDIASFASAHAYARSRELGEAYAWLNQYRLCQARDALRGNPHAASCVLRIENDQDFGTQAVDVFARIRALEQAGAPEDAILQELAALNANMFPCGMGEHNHKTYGQCNRWDWLLATQRGKPGAFQHFLDTLGCPPSPNAQKLLMKFNQFTDTPSGAGDGDDIGAVPLLSPALAQLASDLPQLPQSCSLPDLYRCGVDALPDAQLGIARHSCRRNVD